MDDGDDPFGEIVYETPSPSVRKLAAAGPGCFWVAMCSVPLGVGVLVLVNGGAAPGAWAAGLGLIAVAIIAATVFLRLASVYRRVRLVVRKGGIEIVNAFSSCRVPWQDVERIEQSRALRSAGGVLVVTTDGRRLPSEGSAARLMAWRGEWPGLRAGRGHVYEPTRAAIAALERYRGQHTLDD